MSEITGTREAFANLIAQKAVSKRINVSRATVSQWKKNPPSINKMEEMLLKAGAKVVSEKVWEI